MQRALRLFSLLLVLGLLAAACGGSDESDEAADDGGGLDDESVSDAMAMSDDEDGEDGAGASAAPASMEEYEALWAEKRAEVVELLSSEEYGVGEDDVLRGPGGFELDLSRCPSNWSPTEGVDGDTIKVAKVLPQSGPLAGFGTIAAGMESYFSYVNENGGIDGKRLELIARDDGYVATQTIEVVDELLEVDKPFSITTLGTPNTFAVYDKLNDRCVPQPFVATGHPAWGDPVAHPWTTGMILSYQTEAILWGNWIAQNLSDQLPVKVGALVMDNDFGASYRDAFSRWADDHPEVISEFDAVPHDPAASDVTNEMTTITAGEPDVYISMTTGNACLLAVEEAANSGLTEAADILFTSSTCRDTTAYLDPAGEAGDGVMVAGGGLRSMNDPDAIDEPYIAFMRERLEADGRDLEVGAYATGFAQYAWPHVEALRIAAELEGGLTRPNYLLALHALDLEHPFLLDGVAFSVNGTEDAYYIEGTEFAAYNAETQTFDQVGSVIDLDGLSGVCEWDGTSC